MWTTRETWLLRPRKEPVSQAEINENITFAVPWEKRDWKFRSFEDAKPAPKLPASAKRVPGRHDRQMRTNLHFYDTTPPSKPKNSAPKVEDQVSCLGPDDTNLDEVVVHQAQSTHEQRRATSGRRGNVLVSGKVGSFVPEKQPEVAKPFKLTSSVKLGYANNAKDFSSTFQDTYNTEALQTLGSTSSSVPVAKHQFSEPHPFARGKQRNLLWVTR
mmetsp:Transcript_37971/g.72799  ORF Transcript_37971/g.72799 Transcript_37971/m.72799 type:complete len:215 (+) Transcript_37971:50-694(+)